MTLEEIQDVLFERAAKRFGKARAEELRQDIEQTAADLLKISEHAVGVDDEP